MLLTPSSRLADAIFSDPSFIPVVNRFGIYLGVGDASVEEVCHAHEIDLPFFLAVANTFLNENYFPEEAADAFPPEKVIRYLTLTDNYYADIQLPNIERHFQWLMQRSARDNNLSLLLDFFTETRRELLSCIEADRDRWFPMVLELHCGNPGAAENADPSMPEALARRGVADKVGDLASFFVMHLKGVYDRNLCVAVVSAVFSLARDISQNNRIRERILCPLAESLINSAR